MTRATASSPAERSSDILPLLAAFMLVVGFTFSDDFVEFLLDVTGHPRFSAKPWLVFMLDGLLVLGTAVLKWRISGGREGLTTFLRRLVTGTWGVGAVLVVAGHLTLIATANHRAGLGDVASVGINLVASVVFVAAMTLLLLSALGAGKASRDWIVPLVVGTFAVHVATVLWYPVIEVEAGCAGEVSATYFSDMANILAVMLLALGVELNFGRRTGSTRDLGRRVAPVLTMALLCVGLALSFTMLVKADLGRLCGLGAVWHEYISFVVTTQALAIGLSTLVWLMVVEAINRPGTE